jgi:hypothetical protein
MKKFVTAFFYGCAVFVPFSKQIPPNNPHKSIAEIILLGLSTLILNGLFLGKLTEPVVNL